MFKVASGREESNLRLHIYEFLTSQRETYLKGPASMHENEADAVFSLAHLF